MHLSSPNVNYTFRKETAKEYTKPQKPHVSGVFFLLPPALWGGIFLPEKLILYNEFIKLYRRHCYEKNLRICSCVQ